MRVLKTPRSARRERRESKTELFVTCLLACLLTARSVAGFDPGRGPPSDTGPPPNPANEQPVPLPPEPATLPGVFSLPDSDRWHQNLLRERQMEVRLRAARREIIAGRFVAGLSELQAIIDRDEDLFVRLEDEPVPRGAHFLASRIVGSLSSEGLATYETLFGGRAESLLKSATAGPHPDLLAEVVRRFYHTAAGFDAGKRLAVLWRDHGHDELAWSWWKRVLAEPAHRRRVQPLDRVQAAHCARRLGLIEPAGRIAAALPKSQILTLAGRSQSWEQWLAEGPLPRDRRQEASLAVVGGNPHDGSAAGSGPALGHRLWETPLAGEKSGHVQTLARAWEQYQLQNGLPIGTSQFPVVVSRALVYRDYEGLRAVDLDSGRPLWYFPCDSSVSREISSQQAAPVDGNPDPNNAMRAVVGNCLLGMLASDGRRVFAIDRVELDEPAPGTPRRHAGDEPLPQPRPSNVLLTIDLAEAAEIASGATQKGGVVEPQWIVGGQEEHSNHELALAGHFFLGAPLPVADRLFAVSEHSQQLFLSCLEAATGRVVWRQAICSISQPIGGDYQRFALVCSPVYCEGLVLCPTQSGVLVAVDSLSGKLLWAAAHDDLEPQQKQQMSGWPYAARRRFGHPGYLNLPLVAESNVVYLPAHSEFVHCLDLTTGRLRWRAPREDLEPSTATEYVSAIAAGTVVVVGHRRCRGLDLTSGAERWNVRLGSSPSGRGVCLGSTYHLPLDDGKLISLEIRSGRQCGLTPAAGGLPLGNLVASDDRIVSLGIDRVSVYPQAAKVSARLEDELASKPAGPAERLQAAELDLSLGQFDRALARLTEVVERDPQTKQAARAGELFCELAALGPVELRTRHDGALERMALVAGRNERGTALIQRCRAAFERKDSAAALAAARELASLDLTNVDAVPHDPSRTVAACVAAAELVREMAGRGTGAHSPESEMAADVARVSERGEIAALRPLIRLYGGFVAADEARLRLAGLLAQRGDVQQAETALLALRASEHPDYAARATRHLAELWDARGLYAGAALLLEELGTKFSNISVGSGQTGSQWLASLSHEGHSWIASRKLAPPLWSGQGVQIVEQRAPDEALQSIYNGNGVQYLTTPRHLPFDLFDQGRGGAATLRVVDRQRGIDYPEKIHLPGRSFYPVSLQPGYLQHSFVGNFVPLGGAGALYGISLLERRLLWTNVPCELEGVKDVVRAGPAGPEFCVFQNRHRLFVLDPCDGRLLWQRDDIEPTAGLMSSDPALGIIGDERVLAVFASNGANYTIYDTATGAELRRGKLDIQTRMLRRAMGRRLFHFTSAVETRRARVWDALSNHMLWDAPAQEMVEASVFEGAPPGTKVAQFVRETDELAFVTPSGRIRVVDLASGRNRFEFSIGTGLLENLSAIRAFRDRDRYFFSLQHSPPPGGALTPSGTFIADAAIPCVHIQGNLCAFDLKSERVLWQKQLGNRSLLYLPEFPLPVLVTMCRVRKQDQSHLDLEILDIKTGETLARRDDLLSDRLLQVSYERQPGVIALRGAKTAIRLEFPSDETRLSAGQAGR